MDIKELNKKQLILLTLLITFIVSIATGIVTVSLMQQIPESVPQTVNNVIQRTIEKVTTVQVPVSSIEETKEKSTKDESNMLFIGDGNVLVSVYASNNSEKEDNSEDLSDKKNILNVNSNQDSENADNEAEKSQEEQRKILGQGVLISDIGLVLVDSSILVGFEKYKIILEKAEFNVSVLKKFDNGFTVLKINQNDGIEEKENKEKKINQTIEDSIIGVDNQ